MNIICGLVAALGFAALFSGAIFGMYQKISTLRAGLLGGIGWSLWLTAFLQSSLVDNLIPWKNTLFMSIPTGIIIGFFLWYIIRASLEGSRKNGTLPREPKNHGEGFDVRQWPKKVMASLRRIESWCRKSETMFHLGPCAAILGLGLIAAQFVSWPGESPIGFAITMLPGLNLGLTLGMSWHYNNAPMTKTLCIVTGLSSFVGAFAYHIVLKPTFSQSLTLLCIVLGTAELVFGLLYRGRTEKGGGTSITENFCRATWSVIRRIRFRSPVIMKLRFTHSA
jgi:hypothetical protein